MNRLEDLKVIDFHIHIGLKEHWHEWVHDFQKAINEELYQRYDELIDPKNFSAYLRSHNIEKAVILPDISPISTGIVSNEYVLEFCQDEEILQPFCTVNPFLVSQPAQEFKKFIEMGAKGLKLYPSYNHYYPNDNSIYPLYAMAEQNQLPVLIHTGSSVFKGSKIKYSDPLFLDDVAVDFPGLILLLAHSGRGLWYDRAFLLSRLHENLFLEISGLPPQNLLNYFPGMEKNIDKFIYGSDWPGVKSIFSNIEAIKELPLAEGSIRKILHDNAARILK